MITLIVGKKGSGKTKRLIQMTNEAVERSNGNVVLLEKDAQLTYNISHDARLIDTESYSVRGYDALYGFVCGICAGNYDVTDILIDSILKIGGEDLKDFESFISKIADLSKAANTNFVLSISAESSDLPSTLKGSEIEII